LIKYTMETTKTPTPTTLTSILAPLCQVIVDQKKKFDKEEDLKSKLPGDVFLLQSSGLIANIQKAVVLNYFRCSKIEEKAQHLDYKTFENTDDCKLKESYFRLKINDVKHFDMNVFKRSGDEKASKEKPEKKLEEIFPEENVVFTTDGEKSFGFDAFYRGKGRIIGFSTSFNLIGTNVQDDYVKLLEEKLSGSGSTETKRLSKEHIMHSLVEISQQIKPKKDKKTFLIVFIYCKTQPLEKIAAKIPASIRDQFYFVPIDCVLKRMGEDKSAIHELFSLFA